MSTGQCCSTVYLQHGGSNYCRYCTPCVPSLKNVIIVASLQVKTLLCSPIRYLCIHACIPILSYMKNRFKSLLEIFWKCRREQRHKRNGWHFHDSRKIGQFSTRIHEVQWRHQRHCYNTPPFWRYSLCEQALNKMRKSDISHAQVIRRTYTSYSL